ncbi:hypothetical protein UT300003_26170 [Clostridium sardiniense]
MENLTKRDIEQINGGKDTGWQAVGDGLGGAVYGVLGLGLALGGDYPQAAEAFSNTASCWDSLFE